SLLPPGREAAAFLLGFTVLPGITDASQPSGSKLPRHKKHLSLMQGFVFDRAHAKPPNGGYSSTRLLRVHWGEGPAWIKSW
ncbi:hypothetical protein, partial [Pseudomonas sp. PS01299]|uniref:hypothetical protein n=1 Tax=Pseudomonas sp. PS01299 TaxID=2991435 RepID=UPI00249BC8C3